MGSDIQCLDDTIQDVDLSDVSLLLEKNLRHPGLFVWLLTLSAGFSGLLFGCRVSPSRMIQTLSNCACR